MIKEQKQNVILGMLWLAYYNPEINQKTEEVKMIRCLEKCEKQQRLKQGKSGWKKQKEKKQKKEVEKKQEEREQKKKERKKK